MGLKVDSEENLPWGEFFEVRKVFHFFRIVEVHLIESIIFEGHLIAFILQLFWIKTVVARILNPDINVLIAIVPSHFFQVEDCVFVAQWFFCAFLKES